LRVGTSGGGGCFRRAVVLAVLRARRCRGGGAAVRWSWRPRCGCCHRRRCGQRAPLPHWGRLLPFPKPAFVGAGTVARVSDGRRPPWELVAVAGAVCRRADARRHCLALAAECASAAALPGEAPWRAFRAATSVAAPSDGLWKTSNPAQPVMLRTSNITLE
jgi:hypothetical protein